MHAKTDLKARLDARIRTTGETPAALARALNVAPQTMSKLMKGLTIAPDTRIALIKKLDDLEMLTRRVAGQKRRQARARGESVETT